MCLILLCTHVNTHMLLALVLRETAERHVLWLCHVMQLVSGLIRSSSVWKSRTDDNSAAVRVCGVPGGGWCPSRHKQVKLGHYCAKVPSGWHPFIPLSKTNSYDLPWLNYRVCAHLQAQRISHFISSAHSLLPVLVSTYVHALVFFNYQKGLTISCWVAMETLTSLTCG